MFYHLPLSVNCAAVVFHARKVVANNYGKLISSDGFVIGESRWLYGGWQGVET